MSNSSLSFFPAASYILSNCLWAFLENSNLKQVSFTPLSTKSGLGANSEEVNIETVFVFKVNEVVIVGYRKRIGARAAGPDVPEVLLLSAVSL